MKLSEILTALFALSQEERAEVSKEDREKIAEALGFELADSQKIAELEGKVQVADDKLQVVLSENRDMSEALKAYKDTERKASRDKVIEAALEDGKILEKNRPEWERLFDADPEGTEKVLSAKGKEIDFEKHGTSKGADAVRLSDVDKRAAADAGMTPEEYAALMRETFGEEG